MDSLTGLSSQVHTQRIHHRRHVLAKPAKPLVWQHIAAPRYATARLSGGALNDWSGDLQMTAVCRSGVTLLDERTAAPHLRPPFRY